jgi:hypothetical protein
MRSPIALLLAASAVVSTAAYAGDTYDKDETEVVLKRAARQVHDNCGMATNEDGKRAGPWGKTNITVLLGHNGHSKEVTIPEPFNDKPTGKCAVKAFSLLTFPPWNGPDTSVDWPIEIPPPK